MASEVVAAKKRRNDPAAQTETSLAGQRKGTRMDWGYAVFVLPGIILFLFLVIMPVIANFGISFTRWTGVGVPTWVGLNNYVRAFGDATFWTAFRNNIYLIIAMVIIPTIIGLLLAAALFDYIAKKFGNGIANFLRGGFYLPQIIPIVVAAIVWGWILNPNYGAINTFFRDIGLADLQQNWLGDSSWALPSVMLMLIWFQIGYPLVLFMAGMQRIDPEIYEAAAIDGASWFGRFLRVTVPLLRPEIYVVVLTTTIAALKTFGPIYAMTRGGPGNATMVASYFSYKNFFENASVGYGATMSTVLTVIVGAITVIYIRVQMRQQEEEGI